MKSVRSIMPIMMMFVIGGCVVGPEHVAPEISLPAKFSEGGKTSNGNVAEVAWWGAYRDKRLNGLVDKGLSQNLTILQAMERINAASLNVDVASAGAFPSLSVNAVHNISKDTGKLAKTTETTRTTAGEVSASWMLDLFGQVRRSRESAAASLDSAYAGADVARLFLLSDLVSSYIDARYYQELIALSRKNLASRTETLNLTKLQLDAGAASRLDVVQAEGLVNSTRAEIPGYEINFRRSVHHISTLLGLPASTLLADMQKGARQPVARLRIGAGVPADLIRNRPDIRQAERELAAAVAQIGVAESRLYPSIVLSGSISPSYMASNSVSGSVTSWSFGPSLNLPIFDGGRNKANVKIAESTAQQQYLSWKSTVLNAVEEVENAISAVSRDAQTVAALRATAKSYQEALDLATSSYKIGASSLLDVLDAQRSVSSAEAGLAQAVAQMAKDYVFLQVAIGGGYAAGGVDG